MTEAKCASYRARTSLSLSLGVKTLMIDQDLVLDSDQPLLPDSLFRRWVLAVAQLPSHT